MLNSPPFAVLKMDIPNIFFQTATAARWIIEKIGFEFSYTDFV
jgi:hypothetical protein